MTIRFVTVGDDLTLPDDVIVPGVGDVANLADSASTDGLAVVDSDGRAVLAVDSALELHTAHSPRSLNESAASSYVFRAMRHDTAGNTTEAAYWMDRAENELRRPVRMDSIIAWDGADGALQRIPAVEKLDDGRLIVMWQQIMGNNDGEGVRLVYAFADYDLATSGITLGDMSVLVEPTGWADSLGAAMHAALIKLPADAATHPGRLICVFNQNDNPEGTVASRWLNVYEVHSDDDGATWSTPAKIHDAPGTSDGRYAATGTCGSLVRIPSGTNAGRIIQPIYASDGTTYSLYSDDDGATWTAGADINTGAYSTSEWAVAWRPDGTLIAVFRYSTAGDEVYATSADDGETWTFVGAKTDWPTTTCARSMVQASTSPDDGNSKILWSGLSNSTTNLRKGLTLRVSHDGGLTYQTQYDPYPAGKDAGYSDIKMIGPDTFVCVWEMGFNSACSVWIYIANMSEVYARGTHTV